MDKKFNDKLFDLMLDEALTEYVNKLENEIPGVPAEVMAEFDASKDELWERIESNIKKEKRKRMFSAKRIIILAAALVIVISAAFSASAIKGFVNKTYTKATDKVLSIRLEKEYKQQYEDITRFEFKDELIIPTWLPEGMKLVEITDEEISVTLTYEDNNGKSIFINQYKIPDAGNNELIIENNEWKTYETTILGMHATIANIISDIKLESHTAIFSSNNIIYDIDGNIPQDTFNKFLDNLKFFK